MMAKVLFISLDLSRLGIDAFVKSVFRDVDHSILTPIVKCLKKIESNR